VLISSSTSNSLAHVIDRTGAPTRENCQRVAATLSLVQLAAPP
jgi:hypothetical protein